MLEFLFQSRLLAAVDAVWSSTAGLDDSETLLLYVVAALAAVVIAVVRFRQRDSLDFVWGVRVCGLSA